MNVTPSIRLAVLLALGIVAPAHAGDTLSLRLNADAQRGGVHLVAAEQSTQRLRPNNASAMGGKTLQLVGRDAKGAAPPVSTRCTLPSGPTPYSAKCERRA